MNKHRIAAGALALAMALCAGAPAVEFAAPDASITAYAATKPSWDVHKYYQLGEFTYQYVQRLYADHFDG